METPEEAFVRYIHRIGRTGRAGATGIALSFLALPLGRLQKAAAAMGGRHAAGFPLPGRTEGRGGDELSRRIYPPGTTDLAKQRDRDRFELTHPKAGDDGESAFDSAEEEAVRINPSEDPDSDRESGDSNDNARRPRKHLRRDDGSSATLAGDGRKESPVLYSDESLLRPLWNFFIHCMEGNGYSREEAVRALRQQTYSKIDLPPVLAFIMHEVSTQKGKYGTITQ
ncbi:unnamed protein product [Phytomonas sp. Hart1]|nr:unnamed protein product [Phytomonas sp. Hart1]|eukprot:CCW69071.1 unnamed protein product [Phytomonas sp. isolate Hart1]